MNLSAWADAVGVSKHTAYRWYREGNLPVPAERAGRLILVAAAGSASSSNSVRTVAYCRVSSHDQRADLERQAGRVSLWASANGLTIDEVVTEVGSGINGKRKRLARLLSDPSVANIVVEHRDRLARFGVEHLASALSASGRTLFVVDETEIDDDLIRDMTEVLTSFCARLYGRRGARNRALRAVTTAKSSGS
jgi:putative resolvase